MKSKWRLTSAVIEPFRLIAASLLSLLLPLAFLLLGRLSAMSSSSSSVYLHAIPVHLYAIVSSMTISTLIHGLTSKLAPYSSNLDRPIIASRPRLYLSWIILCVFQISVGLGIKETTMIFPGVAELKIQKDGGYFTKIVFFLGLHETMFFWYRSVVKPVVDDTVYGDGYREESMAERVVLAVSCGSLWWWKLRDEIEGLVGGGNNVNNGNKFEAVDFVNWWLYYLVGTIGMVRVVKGVLWVAMILLFKRIRRNFRENISSTGGHGHGHGHDDDDDDSKV